MTDPKTEGQPDVPSSSVPLAPAFLNSPGRFLTLTAGVFAVHVLLRLVMSRVTVLDESEQIVFAQSWQWGYGPQPPLYTWIQILFFDVFGTSILGLTLLKNALLFACYAFTYGAGRVVTRSHLGGMIAALGLLLIPQIAWESQRDLTHSVLAMTLSTATLFAFLKLHRSPTPWRYLLLGMLFGLGMLSNYNYAMLLVGLLIAAACLKEFRPVVVNGWMIAAVTVAVVMLLPHAQWCVQHWSVVFSSSHKLRIQDETSFMVTAVRALGNLIAAWLSHIGSIVGIFLLLCWRQLVPFPRETLRRPQVRLLLWLTAIALAGIAVAMVLSRATSFKGRWLQPLFFCVSILCAALVQPRLTRAALRRILGAAALVAAIVMVLMPGRLWVADELGRVEGLNAPYRELMAQLHPELEPAQAVLTDTLVLGGNLRLLFPQKPVMTPQCAAWPPGSRARPMAIVFEATGTDTPPVELRQLLAKEEVDVKPDHIHFVELPMPGDKKPLRLGAVLVP
jgi:hypothetical protein